MWPLAEEGRWQEAATADAEAARRFPGSLMGAQSAVFLKYHFGDLDGLQHTLDSLSAHGPSNARGWIVGRKSDLALLRGREVQALRLYADAGAAIAKFGGGAPGGFSTPLADSAGSDPHGDLDTGCVAARRGAPGRGARGAPHPRAGRGGSPVLQPRSCIRARGQPRARPCGARRVRPRCSRYHAQALLGIPGARCARRDCARGKPAHRRVGGVSPRASEFRRAAERLRLVCLYINLARAFDAAHQSDSAIVMYQRYLDAPYLWRIGQEPFQEYTEPIDPIFLARAPTVAARSELYEEKGRRGKGARPLPRICRTMEGCGPGPSANC